MFKTLGQWIDRELEECGLSRKDLRINFRFRGRKYYYPAFSPVWWILTVLGMAAASFGLWAFCVCMILLGPQ